MNDDNSPMKVANFNGVGGGTVIYTAHWPRMHPSDFKVKSLDGVADDWPIDYWALEHFSRRERPHDGRVGPRRRSRRAAARAADAANSARQDRHALRPGDEQARLALVALRHHHRHDALRRPRAVHQPRPLHAGLRPGRRGQHRHHLWPVRSARRRAGHALPGARDHDQQHGMAAGAIYYDADGKEHFQPAEVVIVACNGVGTPRLLLNSASARFPNELAASGLGRQET